MFVNYCVFFKRSSFVYQLWFLMNIALVCSMSYNVYDKIRSVANLCIQHSILLMQYCVVVFHCSVSIVEWIPNSKIKKSRMIFWETFLQNGLEKFNFLYWKKTRKTLGFARLYPRSRFRFVGEICFVQISRTVLYTADRSILQQIAPVTSNVENGRILCTSQNAGLRPAMLAIAVSVRRGNLFCLDFTDDSLYS